MNHDNPVPERHECDVLVIGGGPAGSTVSPFLAEKGHRVVLLEKAHHPRFHIGESLLPANLPLLERLGVDVHEDGRQTEWHAKFLVDASGRDTFIDQRSMLAFKALYCAANITQPRRALAAWRNRRANIRPTDDAALTRIP